MIGPEARLESNFEPHGGEAWCCSFSADGKWLFTGGGDQSVLVHDAQMLKTAWKIDGFRTPVVGLSYAHATLATTGGQSETQLFAFEL